MSRPTKTATGLGVVAVLGIAGFLTWFFVLQSDGPDAATIESAAAAVQDASNITSSTVATPADEPIDLSGTWTVDPDPDPDKAEYPFTSTSYVGYRVTEELAGIGGNTVVGRTPSVDATLDIDGNTISVVEVVADLSALESDTAARDDTLREEGLQTATYPDASFRLSEPIVLASPPTDGATISVEATGELTLHGVTHDIVVPLEATLVGDTIVVIGRAEVVFEDYDISKPTAALVVSIEDVGELELQLFFTQRE